MKKIYSKVKPEILLHVVNRKQELTGERQDLSPSEQYLQVAFFGMADSKTFRPHKHLTNIRTTDITQESWIVIEGAVKAILYDIDDSIIAEEVLQAGDCSITFRGGHTYECLENGTIVYEFKTGPYFGQEKDKEFI